MRKLVRPGGHDFDLSLDERRSEHDTECSNERYGGHLSLACVSINR